jgi:hypothetical protein
MEGKVKVRIIRPHQGLPYFKVSCPCCPKFLETEHRHHVALYLAGHHANIEHPKPELATGGLIDFSKSYLVGNDGGWRISTNDSGLAQKIREMIGDGSLPPLSIK